MVIDWSQAGTGRPKAGERERTRAAAYVRMSTEHQKYSTDNQMAVIRRYADSRQYEVVRTYTDSGKSGLRLVGRDALQALLQDVESGLADYTAILVYDVSRWGRFQDPDEAAAIELRCKHAGIVVHYCAEQFENDGSIGSSIVKTVKRAMAGEYSRELSVKVFAGQANLIRLGYRQGGTPGFGLRRVLVDQTGNHKIELARGEHKSIATDRVILVPGPADEVALVQQIYRSFVEDGLGERQIADMLNDQGVMTDLGRAWTRGAVHQVLINEKYVGNNVWGRTSFKLKQVHKRNPPEAWIRFDGAFEPLVPIEAFRAARAIIEARALRMSDETMLAKLEQVLRQKGMLTGLIIDEIDDLPSSSSYACRFGSLLRAYALVGFVPDRDYRYLEINRRLRHLHPEIINDVIRGIAMAGGQAIQDASTDLLYINNEFSTSIVIVRCLETEAGALRWKVRLDAALNPDLTIAVRMRRGNDAPLDYYLLPRLDMHEAVLRLCEFNGLSLDCYRFDSLSHLYEMSERKQMLKVA
ncbi:recombinase family protein [Mesorhizobium sp. M3A.F.Ca.ET.201.01.1.1]|uniref:recombinase family protein n=1 Tax=Mesorhizobium sp. M3A.F.Ca.ET.201.01.1.1 TaxID=2563946 RepID=UPI001093F3A1|nr:recombinase family protein [Mesorhizobium sp. M3A.F.Ca.ET.201.01.1.1]TGS69495.1 recombinase family protein [Mesorhizobium sp. M3A.F.Ca.ET.201.01.1.1]